MLQVREVGGVRLLQLKNPWAKVRWRGSYSAEDPNPNLDPNPNPNPNQVRWKGSYSAEDRVRWTAALRTALSYDPSQARQLGSRTYSLLATHSSLLATDF